LQYVILNYNNLKNIISQWARNINIYIALQIKITHAYKNKNVIDIWNIIL
jgi:hypothetical protein